MPSFISYRRILGRRRVYFYVILFRREEPSSDTFLVFSEAAAQFTGCSPSHRGHEPPDR